MERVLQEKLHSPAERGFSFVIGAKGLKDALKLYEDRPKYQRLVIEFEKGEDPDDAYSEVPYEKGANFLLYLGQLVYHLFPMLTLFNESIPERVLGGLDVFLPYIHDYVYTFTGKSITTDVWKAHLYKYFTEHGGDEKLEVLNSVQWEVRYIPSSSDAI